MTLGNQLTNPIYPFWPYYGWFDLGPVQLPPLPPVIGLTDRTIPGVVWYITWNNATGHLQIQDSDPFPQGRPAKVYPPFDGPWIGNSGWRLGVDVGHIIIDNDIPPFREVVGYQSMSVESDNAPGPIAMDPTQLVTVALMSVQFPPIPGQPDPHQTPHLQTTTEATQ